MSQFRLPDQVPVTWARINSSGEGGTKAAHIDGGGTGVYNYLMHTELLPVSANISLQTRLRAKLINMTVDNSSFEGAAVLHRGFKMTGTEPNLKLDTQVWSSNPQAGGRKHWISGNDTEFRDYNFIIPLPERDGMDYVTWELAVRAPGQIIVSDVQCRHYYGKLYEMDISGQQLWDGQVSGNFNIETVEAAASLGGDINSRRWVRYLKTEEIVCRKGQNIVTSSEGAMNCESLASGETGGFVVIPSTMGFSLKLRRRGTSTEDWLDLVDRYVTEQSVTRYDESRQRRARYDYDRAQIVFFVQPHTPSNKTTTTIRFGSYREPLLDLLIADFVAPSQ